MLPLDLYARVPSFAVCIGTRDRGCSVHPVFPAPSDFRGGHRNAKLRAHRAARSRSRFCERRLYENRIRSPDERSEIRRRCWPHSRISLR